MERSSRDHSQRRPFAHPAVRITVVTLLIAVLVAHPQQPDDDVRLQLQLLKEWSRLTGTDPEDWQPKYVVQSDRVFEHIDGLRSVRINGDDVFIASYTAAPAVHANTALPNALRLGEAEERAIQFVVASGITRLAPPLLVSDRVHNVDRGTFDFKFTSYEQRVELPIRIAVRIEERTGDLLQYNAVCHLPLQVGLTPVVSARQAEDVALRATRLNEAQVTNAQLFVWPAYWMLRSPEFTPPAEQVLLWRVSLRGERQTQVDTGLHGTVAVAQTVTEEYEVDAHNGQLRSSHVISERIADQSAQMPPRPKALRAL